MKLPKGPLKVIHFANEAVLEENERRRRAGGSVFHPTVHVTVQPADEGSIAATFSGFAINASKFEVKSAVTNWPHVWAVHHRTRVRYWLETTDAVEIIPNV
jgi:hypothetical protein